MGACTSMWKEVQSISVPGAEGHAKHCESWQCLHVSWYHGVMWGASHTQLGQF